MRTAKYMIGQVVRHRIYPFRGIIFDVGVWNKLFFLGLLGVPTGAGRAGGSSRGGRTDGAKG